MGHKHWYDLVHTKLAASWLVAELPHEDLVVPIVRAFEDLVNLIGSLFCLQTLFYDIWREFQLAKAHKVTSNEVEDLVITKLVLQFENILD